MLCDGTDDCGSRGGIEGADEFLPICIGKIIG
jgi:hypothetical protein